MSGARRVGPEDARPGRRRAVTRVAALGAILALVAGACGSSSKKSSSATTSGGSSSTASNTNTSYPPIPAGPMTVCVSVALSGLTATQGTQASFNAAANLVNTQYGGIAGHKVSVTLVNDSGNATTAVQNINQFVSQHQSNPNNCVAEVGMDYDPSIQPSMVAVTSKNKMITILDSSVDDYFDAAKYPYLFPINPSDAAVGTAVGHFIAGKKWTKWAVLTDGIPQETQEIQDDLAGAKKAGLDPVIVKTATVSPGASNVQTQLLELKQANPDVVLVMIGLGYGAVWNGMKAAGWSPNIIGDLAAFYFEYNDLGPLAQNAFSPAWYGSIPNHPQLPSNIVSFMNVIGPYNGAPNYPGLLIAANVDLNKILLVKWAVEKYNSVDSDAMKKALETLNDQAIFWQGNKFTENATTHVGLIGPYSAGAMNMAQLGPMGIFQYADATGSPLSTSAEYASLDSTTGIWPPS
jgi:ABC-type branched-subunit amino acid transport system substrate-binding protein